MRKFVMLGLVLLLVAGLTPAKADSATLRQRVSTLETKVTRLTRKVNRLQAFTHNCIAFDWAPLTSYGDPDPTAAVGYLFDNNDGSGTFTTSALDFTVEGDSAHIFVAALNPSCLSSVAARTTALRTELRRLAGSDRKLVRAE